MIGLLTVLLDLLGGCTSTGSGARSKQAAEIFTPSIKWLPVREWIGPRSQDRLVPDDHLDGALMASGTFAPSP
jgi:hypothetical protein